jgi:hypothetical protein
MCDHFLIAALLRGGDGCHLGYGLFFLFFFDNFIIERKDI